MKNAFPDLERNLQNTHVTWRDIKSEIYGDYNHTLIRNHSQKDIDKFKSKIKQLDSFVLTCTIKHQKSCLKAIMEKYIHFFDTGPY
jgi:hypothetical protein